MAKLIVNLFKTVQVEIGDSQQGLLSEGGGDGLIQAVGQENTIGKPVSES